MPRRSLDDALGATPPPTPVPPPAPPREDPVREPDRYKLTVVLEEWEHEQLERITDAVLADVRPRRVGKGWRTKVIRALLAEAMAGDDPDPAAVRRIADRLRES